MWASLVDNSEPKRVLPRGQNWILSNQTFNGKTVALELVGHSSGDEYSVEFEPIYWAMSDEWIEAYGNLSKKTDGSLNLKSFKNSIEEKFREQRKNYDDIDAYFISAMEWNIRFISCAEPIVRKRK